MDESLGCCIRPVTDPVPMLDWINGKSVPSDDLGFSPKWVLALCFDGVTWGVYQDTWEMASQWYDMCPRVTPDNLTEVRIFGDHGEALIWRESDGLAGRILSDTKGVLPPHLEPFDRCYLLVGPHYRSSRGRFVHTANKAGREQVLPVSRDMLSADFSRNANGSKSPFVLTVRYYLEEEEQSGAVRVSASRLVRVGVTA